jgi:site-specific DNA recombinase
MPVAPEYLHLVYPDLDVNALIYGRNSHDPTGKGRSVASQVDEGTGMCDQFSWSIAHVYDKDIGRSASRHARRTRDDFEALLEAIEAKAGNMVIAFEASRYYRDLEAYVRLRNACTEAGVLLCYNGTIYDLSKRADRKVTAMDAVDAEDEAEAIRDRALRGQRTRAAAGRPGGRTPFGYKRRYDPDTGELIDQVPHPDTADIVREIFKRFDAGKTMYSMVRWLNGLPEAAYASGKPWAQDRLRTVLTNPTYIGKRHVKGVVVGDGSWDPLIKDETLWHRVQRRISDPSRRTMRDSQVRHLMSGLALCGQCPDEPHMTPRPWAKEAQADPAGPPPPRQRSYICSEKWDVAIAEHLLDAYVEEAVLTYLRSPAARAAFEAPDSREKALAAEALLERLTAQLDEARTQAATFRPDGTPLLSIATLSAIEGQLAPQITKAKQAAAGALAAGLSPVMKDLLHADPDALDALWADMELPEKRDVLRRVVTVRVNKAPFKGMQKITLGRVGLAFRGDPGFKGLI